MKKINMILSVSLLLVGCYPTEKRSINTFNNNQNETQANAQISSNSSDKILIENDTQVPPVEIKVKPRKYYAKELIGIFNINDFLTPIDEEKVADGYLINRYRLGESSNLSTEIGGFTFSNNLEGKDYKFLSSLFLDELNRMDYSNVILNPEISDLTNGIMKELNLEYERPFIRFHDKNNLINYNNEYSSLKGSNNKFNENDEFYTVCYRIKLNNQTLNSVFVENKNFPINNSFASFIIKKGKIISATVNGTFEVIGTNNIEKYINEKEIIKYSESEFKNLSLSQSIKYKGLRLVMIPIISNSKTLEFNLEPYWQVQLELSNNKGEDSNGFIKYYYFSCKTGNIL